MEEITLIQERVGFPLSEEEVRKQKIASVTDFWRFEIERRRKLIEPDIFMPGKTSD